MRNTILGFMLAAAVMPASARAGEPRTHDGFFLRMAPGFGYSEAKGNGSKFDGASGSFELAIGAAVSHNFAIHATFDGWALFDQQAPQATAYATPLPASGPGMYGHDGYHNDNHVGLGMWGAGATYWFGKSNAYVTASAGAARLYYNLHFDDYCGYGYDCHYHDDYAHSDTGFAFTTGVGKEWWVGDGWGLGVSGTFGYATVPPRGPGSDYKGPTFAVRFSATLN
jgi:hypothetical protein